MKKLKDTIHINLFGGPSVGKSSLALKLTSHFKHKGYSVDMTMEYAKECVYDEDWNSLTDQLHVAGEQHKRMSRLNGKVDIAIHDSPFIMGLIYCCETTIAIEPFELFMIEQFKRYNNYNLFLESNPSIPYEYDNRIQNLEESLMIGKNIKSFLEESKIEYTAGINDDLFYMIVNFIENRINQGKINE